MVFALSAAIARSDIAAAAQAAAGAGLRDTTRIGASSPSLWAEILLDNRNEVLRASQEFQAELDTIIRALRDGDRSALEALFSVASQWRSNVQDRE